jgi:hypothetical protein
VLGSNDKRLPPEIARIGGHPRIEFVKNTYAGQCRRTAISRRENKKPDMAGFGVGTHVWWGALATVHCENA